MTTITGRNIRPPSLQQYCKDPGLWSRLGTEVHKAIEALTQTDFTDDWPDIDYASLELLMLASRYPVLKWTREHPPHTFAAPRFCSAHALLLKKTP